MPTTAEPKKEAQPTERLIEQEIQDAQKKAQIPIKSRDEVFSRFAANPQPDGSQRSPEQIEAKKENGRQEPVEAPKKPSYVKSLEIQKREAEEKRQAIEAERNDLAQKLKEATEKLNKAKTEEDFQKALQERDKAIEDSKKQMEQIVSERDRLRQKVTLYDLTEDPIFVENFVTPLNRASQDVMEIVGGDQQNLDLVTQVATLNQGVLNAKTPEDKRRFKSQRSEIIERIAEQLPEFEREDFRSKMREVIRASEAHFQAIANHVETAERVKSKRAELEMEAKKKTSETWGTAFKAQSELIDKETQLPEHIQSFIAAKGIEADNSMDDRIAEATITDGGVSYEPKEIARVLKQGAVFKRQQAHIAALQKMLEEKEQTISELRGSGTTGGGSTSGGSGTPTKEEAAKKFFGRFTPKGK